MNSDAAFYVSVITPEVVAGNRTDSMMPFPEMSRGGVLTVHDPKNGDDALDRCAGVNRHVRDATTKSRFSELYVLATLDNCVSVNRLDGQ
ncbi:MAG TPA: hypothetical protein VNI54_05800 [Thermoanaerobaculia bacterium]|nr:hypothetical protein [Thermoanaerobaculia bacterium]